jgi:deazaflavin-dependent oxidoreductase (nitroreductase family)
VDKVHDSPIGWVAKHIREYVETGGRRGKRWHGVDTLLLTTRGRRSGKLRRTALIFGGDGDRFVVVGSNGGKARHPAWYLNLLADPRVEVQVGPEVFPAKAVEADGEERSRLWEFMLSVYPQYASYQQRTSRRIPVVVLDPA